jgi:hypothetical protein
VVLYSGIEKRYGYFKYWSCLKCLYFIYLFIYLFLAQERQSLTALKGKESYKYNPGRGGGGEAKVRSQRRLSVSFFNPTIHLGMGPCINCSTFHPKNPGAGQNTGPLAML